MAPPYVAFAAVVVALVGRSDASDTSGCSAGDQVCAPSTAATPAAAGVGTENLLLQLTSRGARASRRGEWVWPWQRNSNDGNRWWAERGQTTATTTMSTTITTTTTTIASTTSEEQSSNADDEGADDASDDGTPSPTSPKPSPPAGAAADFPEIAEDIYAGVNRRRRAGDMGSCRRRHSTPSSNPPEEAFEAWQCRDNTMVYVGQSAPTDMPTAAPTVEPAISPGVGAGNGGNAGNATGDDQTQPCLCAFDIDRTLTVHQGDTYHCPRTKVLRGVYDSAYGGGDATLSALAAEGIRTTFCDGCVLGICSAGRGSGDNSKWNRYILDNIMRGRVHDAFVHEHADAQFWSYGSDVKSPYVLGQPNMQKQNSVELIRQWYNARGVPVRPDEVYFFDDRTENLAPFREKGLNSHEISCASRDWSGTGEHGMIGYCGATPEEVVKVKGNFVCSGR